jgi:AcrR family transcriptional regulator
MPDTLSSRAREVLDVARTILEREGAAALTMRRVAAEMGIQAPSLYKHFPHKAALETAIIASGFEEAAAAFETAVDGSADPLAAFVGAYRTFAADHPHVYRLMTQRPLPRPDLPPGLEERTAAPLLRAVGTRSRARAAWAFLHGMTILELDSRFPSDGRTESAWQIGVDAFRAPQADPDDCAGEIRVNGPAPAAGPRAYGRRRGRPGCR